MSMHDLQCVIIHTHTHSHLSAIQRYKSQSVMLLKQSRIQVNHRYNIIIESFTRRARKDIHDAMTAIHAVDWCIITSISSLCLIPSSSFCLQYSRHRVQIPTKLYYLNYFKFWRLVYKGGITPFSSLIYTCGRCFRLVRIHIDRFSMYVFVSLTSMNPSWYCCFFIQDGGVTMIRTIHRSSTLLLFIYFQLSYIHVSMWSVG